MKSFFLPALLITTTLFADGPADNNFLTVRPIPPPGIKIPEAARDRLKASLEEFQREISLARPSMTNRAQLELWPDILIFEKAVRYALDYDEFYRTNEVEMGAALIREGLDRLKQFKAKTPLWLTATGLVVRGYLSKIDGSVQPYGLVVPGGFQQGSEPKRLDVWFHGRGEKLTELAFIHERMHSPGEFTPQNTFVLHPYGRYCNGQRFAGETDLFEALDHAGRMYPIDPNRTLVRGFSLGGAACWHIAAHHPGLWAAAAPGAGFSETPDFLKVFQKESLQPAWYEQKLWRLYNATDVALNFFNCPVIAYSGEVDNQKQAADMMSAAMKAEGLNLVHIIGPQTAHKYHPDSKIEINRRINQIAAQGRDPLPRRIKFTTFTLRYNKMSWVTIDALDQHWERATLVASLVDRDTVHITATNISALTLSMAPGLCPFDTVAAPKIVINGQILQGPPVWSDRSWTARLARNADKGDSTKWQVMAESKGDPDLRKRHGLQGPIDDAFMDSFLFVRPSGKSKSPQVSQWVLSEQERAIKEWRRHFRGEARVKMDREVTAEDIREHHLVLWGDAASNLVIEKMRAELPIQWGEQELIVGTNRFSAEHHAPVLIYPNPLNRSRYVVLNSGFTFREYDYLNNARQVPKLPDYAVVDLRTPPGPRYPGKIVHAGFFNERWQLDPKGNQ